MDGIGVATAERLVLDARDAAGLPHAARVDTLAALQRQIARLEASQLRLLAVMADDPAVPELLPDLVGDRDACAAIAQEWVREDVACALRLSAVGASLRLELARDLQRLPATLDALESGEVSLRHCLALAEAVRPLDDQRAAVVESAVLPRAAEQTVAAFRRSVARAVLKVDARRERERHEDELAKRRVCIRPAPHGMAEVWALLPADGAAAIRAALDATARLPREDGDTRTADQRRADALVGWGVRALHGGADDLALPLEHGRRPEVQVTVALSTLLGLDEQPGELDGHGPIPAALARRIAADPTGTWRRLVVDDVGRLVDVGRRSYRPPADLAEFVIARDRTCCFPGCHRRARLCDLDHAIDWADGGTTNCRNLGALCRRHHRAKHVAGWRWRREPDGTTVWTSPTGHTYRRPPATYPLDLTGLLPDDDGLAGEADDTDPHSDPDPPPPF